MKYEYFFVNEPNIIKEDLDIYIKDIIILLEIIDVYIEDQRKIIKKWYDINIDLFSIEFPSLLMKCFIFFFQKIVDKKIYKLSENLLNADIYQTMFLKYQKRLEQFKYFS